MYTELKLASLLREVRDSRSADHYYIEEIREAIGQGFITLNVGMIYDEGSGQQGAVITKAGIAWLTSYSQQILYSVSPEDALKDAKAYWLSQAIYYSHGFYRWSRSHMIPEGARAGAIAGPYSKAIRAKFGDDCSAFYNFCHQKETVPC